MGIGRLIYTTLTTHRNMHTFILEFRRISAHVYSLLDTRHQVFDAADCLHSLRHAQKWRGIQRVKGVR
jgi:hypothetical protein